MKTTDTPATKPTKEGDEMNATERKQILTLTAKIEHQKNRISTERDKLRALYEDLEGVVESVSRGIEGVESGVREILSGLDAMSERL